MNNNIIYLTRLNTESCSKNCFLFEFLSVCPLEAEEGRFHAWTVLVTWTVMGRHTNHILTLLPMGRK